MRFVATCDKAAAALQRDRMNTILELCAQESEEEAKEAEEGVQFALSERAEILSAIGGGTHLGDSSLKLKGASSGSTQTITELGYGSTTLVRCFAVFVCGGGGGGKRVCFRSGVTWKRRCLFVCGSVCCVF